MLGKSELKIKDIDNGEYIEKLFKRISKKKTLDVVVNLENGDVKNTTIEFKKREVYMTDVIFKEQNVKITFIYNDFVFYFFSQVDNVLKIDTPKDLYLLTKRELERHAIEDDENAYVIINKEKYHIANIHTKGLAFKARKRNILKDHLIRDLAISLDDEIIFADAEVRHVEKNKDMYTYGLVFKDIHWLDKMEIIKYIFRNDYTHLRNMSEYSQDELYELYDKSGYFDLASSGLESSFNEMVNVLRKIDDIPHISKSFVYVNEDNYILSGANLVKLYNYTFLAQHLAVKKEAVLNISCKMDIYKATINYVLNHDYFKYYLTYFDGDLEWHKGLYQKIIEYINDPRKFMFETLVWFSALITPDLTTKINSQYSIEKLYDFEEFINYALKNISDLERGCYCYNEEFNLDKIKNIYELKNLYIERKLYKVTENGSLIAYLVAEACTSGLNMVNCPDNVKIYFVNRNINENEFIKAVYNEMSSFYEKFNKKCFYIIINTNYGLNFENINRDKLTRIHDAGRVIANNEGIREYRNYFKTVMR